KSSRLKQTRQKCGTPWKIIEENMLVIGMGTRAIDSKTVERWYAKCRSEVSIRSSTNCTIGELKADFIGEPARKLEKGNIPCGPSHWGAIDAAGDLETGAVQHRLQPFDSLLDGRSTLGIPESHVHLNTGFSRDDIDRGPTFDPADADR